MKARTTFEPHPDALVMHEWLFEQFIRAAAMHNIDLDDRDFPIDVKLDITVRRSKE